MITSKELQKINLSGKQLFGSARRKASCVSWFKKFIYGGTSSLTFFAFLQHKEKSRDSLKGQAAQSFVNGEKAMSN